MMWTNPKGWIEHFFALNGFGNQSQPMADALVDALKAAGFEIVSTDRAERDTP